MSMGFLVGVLGQQGSGSIYHPDAQAWFDALAGSGVTVSTANKSVVSDLITGIENDGDWDKIKLLVLHAGPDSYAGSIIPVRGVTPTVFGTMSAGWSRTTGLLDTGTPASNYIETNVTGDNDTYLPLNNWCMGVYATTVSVIPNVIYFGDSNGNGSINAFAVAGTGIRSNLSRASGSVTAAAGDSLTFSGIIHCQRTTSTDATLRAGNTIATSTTISGDRNPLPIYIFRRNITVSGSNHRQGAYWMGQALTDNGAKLKARMDTYFSSLT
jgi:hypothetical protein